MRPAAKAGSRKVAPEVALKGNKRYHYVSELNQGESALNFLGRLCVCAPA